MKNQQHHPKSSVCLGMTTIFGSKCSCGSVHPSVLQEGIVVMDTSITWCAHSDCFVRKDFNTNPFLVSLLQGQSQMNEFRRTNWGMAKV